jgi:hypothetical protein
MKVLTARLALWLLDRLIGLVAGSVGKLCTLADRIEDLSGVTTADEYKVGGTD